MTGTGCYFFPVQDFILHSLIILSYRFCNQNEKAMLVRSFKQWRGAKINLGPVNYRGRVQHQPRAHE